MGNTPSKLHWHPSFREAGRCPARPPQTLIVANIREREISEIDVQVALTSLLEQSDAVRGELLRSTKLLTDSGSAVFRLSGIQRSVFEIQC